MTNRKAESEDLISELLADLQLMRSRLDAAVHPQQDIKDRIETLIAELGVTLDALKAERIAGSNGHRVSSHRKEVERAEPSSSEIHILTPREKEVLRLIAEGLSTKEIAWRLEISFKTAVSHRTHLLKKLGVHETASLVRVAVRSGLVT